MAHEVADANCSEIEASAEESKSQLGSGEES